MRCTAIGWILRAAAAVCCVVSTGCGDVEIGKAQFAATVAGAPGGPGFFDGSAAAAQALIRFHTPSGVALVGSDAFVADTANHVIRKIDPAGNVSTVAGAFGAPGTADGTGSAARFNSPSALAADGATLYICDTGNHTIRKFLTTTGAVTTLSGWPGTAGFADNAAGPGGVLFSSPKGIAVAGGALFVADSGNHRIRKVTLAGAATTFAGSGTPASADGTGEAASFAFPAAVAAVGTDLFVADTGNHTIRKVTPSGAVGIVTTFAGSPGVPGAADGIGTAARFNAPAGIAAIGAVLYVSDTGNHTIRAVAGDPGVVTTLAGLAGTAGSADGTGTAARFDTPRGIAFDGSLLLVADAGNHLLRRVSPAGTVSTAAGNPPRKGAADGFGAAARFFAPAGIATAADNIFVADEGNGLIRKVSPGGAVATFAGMGGEFGAPAGIAAVGSDLFVTDSRNHTILKVSAGGSVTTIAGSAGLPGSADGTGASARFNSPRGIAAAGGQLYVADAGNHTIRKVTPSGAVTTVAGIPGSPGSNDNPAGTSARFHDPRGIAALGDFLYVADTGNHAIRRIGLVASSHPVTTHAGSAGSPGFADGSAANARFFSPAGIAAVESVLYVADAGNHAIRRIGTMGTVTTFVGKPAAATTRDGEASSVLLNAPSGIAGVPGTLYFTDENENVLRKVLF